MALLPDAALIALREGLEAFVIVGVLAGLVVKLGRPEVRRHIAVGFAVAVLASLALAWAFEALLSGGAAEEGEEVFEMVAGLVAVAVLTYMIVWMWRHTRALAAAFRDKVSVALERDEVWAIGVLAFIAVFREGFEVVLFFAARFSAAASADLLLSALLGFGAAAALAWALFAGTLRVDLAKFFGITGLLLIFLAAGILAHSVHEAEELGLVPETEHLWDTSPWLPEDRLDGQVLRALLGYEATPTLAYLLSYLAYLGTVGAWYLGGVNALRKRVRAAAEAVEPAEA